MTKDLTNDLDGAPTLAEFEAEAEAFLESHAPRRFKEGEARSRPIVIFDERAADEELATLKRDQDWQRTKFDAGFAWITGPLKYGGRGLPPAYKEVWDRLEKEFVLPEQSDLMVGVELVASAILAEGTTKARARYVRHLRRGDLVGCLLLSEPGAGSDLAGVRTSATRNGDNWVVEGQKVWTSAGHLSDVGLLLCRTRSTADKHRGLSAFVIDMDSPGIDVRPLRQMTGGANFNEVFLSEVRVPDVNRLGPVNGGWAVIMKALTHERNAIGSGPVGVKPQFTDAVLQLARERKVTDPLIREDLARLVITDRIAMLLNSRASSDPSDSALTFIKVLAARNHDLRSRIVERILGAEIVSHDPGTTPAGWSHFMLSVPAMHIAGGTDEIVLTTVAEQVLGLPR
jgi:alkylation response protein AidB-like acyl-CoA dehydrogenase